MQLAQRRGVATDEIFELARGDLVGEHFDVVQLDAAAGGQALAHAVPVVEDFEALAAGGQEDRDELAVVANGAD